MSDTGLSSSSSCVPCPFGYFQEAAGQRGCLKCPFPNDDTSSSDILGLASILLCPGVEKSMLTDAVRRLSFALCVLWFKDTAWYFQILSNLEYLRINECFRNPCFNQGQCIALSSGFLCECQPGFHGKISSSFLLLLRSYWISLRVSLQKMHLFVRLVVRNWDRLLPLTALLERRNLQ